MMMERFGFYNGLGTSIEKGLRFLEYPIIKKGREIIKSVSVSGRCGTLTEKTGTYEDTVIINKLHLTEQSMLWDKRFQDIEQWLLASGKVQYSDNQDFFFRVKKVIVKEANRVYGRYGDFEVEFTCNPGEYFTSGTQEYSIGDCKYNRGSVCEPIYHITGEGLCTITVNGKAFKVNVGQKVTIDTERMITYRNDGTISNTDVSGEYEDLYLREGENEITISRGFDCKIIPNWRML